MDTFGKVFHSSVMQALGCLSHGPKRSQHSLAASSTWYWLFKHATCKSKGVMEAWVKVLESHWSWGGFSSWIFWLAMHGTERVKAYVVMDTPEHWRYQKRGEVSIRKLYVSQAIDQQGHTNQICQFLNDITKCPTKMPGFGAIGLCICQLGFHLDLSCSSFYVLIPLLVRNLDSVPFYVDTM